jgi:hypothetical protein
MSDGDVFGVERINHGQGRPAETNIALKMFDGRSRPFYFNPDARAVVQDKAGHTVLVGQPINKGAKADTLHHTVNEDASPHSFGQLVALFHLHGTSTGENPT